MKNSCKRWLSISSSYKDAEAVLTARVNDFDTVPCLLERERRETEWEYRKQQQWLRHQKQPQWEVNEAEVPKSPREESPWEGIPRAWTVISSDTSRTDLENAGFLLAICHSSRFGPFHFMSMNPASKFMVQPIKQSNQIYLIVVNWLILLLKINLIVL